MIVFDLSCDAGHRFEGWFGSSEDYSGQRERGLVACPQCGSAAVGKAPMAPSVPAKGNRQAVAKQPVAGGKLPPELAGVLVKLAEAQAKALENSTWVGDDFTERSRAMHYGDREAEPIHGQATHDEAKELLEEGIAVAPLLVPVVPPEERN